MIILIPSLGLSLSSYFYRLAHGLNCLTCSFQATREKGHVLELFANFWKCPTSRNDQKEEPEFDIGEEPKRALRRRTYLRPRKYLSNVTLSFFREFHFLLEPLPNYTLRSWPDYPSMSHMHYLAALKKLDTQSGVLRTSWYSFSTSPYAMSPFLRSWSCPHFPNTL